MISLDEDKLCSRLKQEIETKKRNIEGAKQNVLNLENQLHGMQTLYNVMCQAIHDQKPVKKSADPPEKQYSLPVGHGAASATVR